MSSNKDRVLFIIAAVMVLIAVAILGTDLPIDQSTRTLLLVIDLFGGCILMLAVGESRLR